MKIKLILSECEGYAVKMKTIHKSVRKLSAILIVSLAFCSGCGNKNDIPEDHAEIVKEEASPDVVATQEPSPTKEPLSTQEPAESPNQEPEDIDLVTETDLKEQSAEDTIITEESVPAAEETTENIETSTDENTLCVGFVKEIFDGTNKERVNAGLPELVWSDELAIAADIRAEEIIDTFSHVRPDGTKCYALGDKIHGENIAKSPPQSTADEFMQHWMDSEGHRENILREQFTMMGVGTRTTDMGITAVQIFGY